MINFPGWWMSYDEQHTPEQYHWGYSLYTHYEAGGMTNVSTMSAVNKIVMVLNGGVSDHFNDISKVHNGTLAVVLYQMIMHAGLLGMFVLLLFTACCVRCMMGSKVIHQYGASLCGGAAQQLRASAGGKEEQFEA